MIIPKLYLYDSTKSDYKGTDYSAHILSGFDYTDDLTEVLDVCNITLVGLPFRTEFDPTTKFILELYIAEGGNEAPFESYHLCVANDLVEQPILSDDGYFNHAITFNEASVIAQGRIIDDCTETYKLKDVSLDVRPTYDEDETCKNTNEETDVIPEQNGNNGDTETGFVGYRTHTYRFTRKYKFKFGSEYGLSGSINDWNNFRKNQVVAGGGTHISLPIPMVVEQVGKKNDTGYEDHENFCSTKTMVFIRNAQSNDEWQLDTTFGNNGVLITNPSTTNATENDWQSDWQFIDVHGQSEKGYGSNGRKVTFETEGSTIPYVVAHNYYKKFADFDNSVQHRTIELDLQSNKEYKIVVTLANLSTPNTYDALHLQTDGDNLPCYSVINSYKRYVGFVYVRDTETNDRIVDSGTSYNNTPSMEMTFTAWAESAMGKIVFTSAPPLSAYDLFIDAQLKSNTRFRGNVYIKDGRYLPFYCEEADIEKLKNVQIIESSFHQKNFWEILLEIGKYIHAIPYVKFGKNNRFLVTWHYLGQAEQYENVGTKISIFNSRSIENYVGAVNSYVNNMIQLGGIIEEVVAPKSESEDYLVYNDSAVIKTSKPIIEILELGVKCIRDVLDPLDPNHVLISSSTTEKDITNNVYEVSIYEILGVVASIEINKGLSLYYNLGENVIRGLNYQLPSVNSGSGDTDYAFKRILGKAYSVAKGDWQNIRINNFIFRIKYRTKENVRSEQSRPDLRKYLINNAYEDIPQHKQFNNQQDVSVDSVKFGNQTYGKLIRTGNTEYTTTEWYNSLQDIKVAGQLVNFDDNLYYVCKSVNKYYQDHIESEITYTKDYNQLSDIIGIPSEPRFYEISERNIIDRQVNINHYLELSTHESYMLSNDFVNGNIGFSYINDLLFKTNTRYPKYALTQFKNDMLNPDTGIASINTFAKDFIHPISGYSMRNTLSLKWEMVDNFSAGDKVDDVNVLDSVDNAYAQLLPTQYVDSYGRADMVDFAIAKDITLDGDQVKAQPNSPYRLLDSSYFKYYGGRGNNLSTSGGSPSIINVQSTLFFTISGSGYVKDLNNNIIASRTSSVGSYIIATSSNYSAIYRCYDRDSNSSSWIRSIIRYGEDLSEFEKASIKAYSGLPIVFASQYDEDTFGTNEHGIILAKDNRERIMFNFNTQILTDSDRFVLSGYMWQQEKKGQLKLVTLNKEVNKIINDTIEVTNDDIIASYNLSTSYTNTDVTIEINSTLSGADLTDVKSIVILSTSIIAVGTGTQRYFVVARNVDGLSNEEKAKDWRIQTIMDGFFKKQ